MLAVISKIGLFPSIKQQTTYFPGFKSGVDKYKSDSFSSDFESTY